MPTVISPKSQNYLIIPVETLNREFDAKLLLACVAAERGFSVIIGAKYDIKLQVGSLPRSIYLAVNLSERDQSVLELLHRLGHTIVGVDEEAVVYLSPEIYLKTRVSPPVFKKTALLFAWGPENARLWRESPDYSGTPIYLSGHPRADLLRPELRPWWSDEAQKIRDRFSRFILINTNFSKLNHFRPGKGEQLQTLQAAAADPAAVSEFDLGLATHRWALFQHFQEMVGALARTRPDLAIVVRPHPSESHEMWRQAAAGCGNVQVIHEGHVVPWLLAAEAVIHNGCTTGIEAYLLGTPAIAYQPVTSERFDFSLPNRLSHQACDLQTLQELVGAALGGTLSHDLTVLHAQRSLIDQYFAPLEGPLAAERIVEALKDFTMTPQARPRPPFRAYLTGKTEAMYRHFKRRYKRRWWEDPNDKRLSRSQYNSHIFSETVLAEVQARIARLQRILDRFAEVSAHPVSKNIFEVRAAGDIACSR